MRVLVACEFSGVVRDAFAAKGHDAWSCDILPTERDGQHYHGDVRHCISDFVNKFKHFDLLIAHPPCTYLCNSGVQHLHKDVSRMDKMREGAEFFKWLLDLPIPRKAIENPIMHKYAVEIIGRRQDQVIQPWMFGHPEMKATCLWLENLPKLVPTNNVKSEMALLPKCQQQRLHYLSPGEDRAKNRARTFDGIANAMAEQWGNYELQEVTMPSDRAQGEILRPCSQVSWGQLDLPSMLPA